MQTCREKGDEEREEGCKKKVTLQILQTVCIHLLSSTTYLFFSVTEITYFSGSNLISCVVQSQDVFLLLCSVGLLLCARQKMSRCREWYEEDAGGSAGSWLPQGEVLSVCIDITV